MWPQLSQDRQNRMGWNFFRTSKAKRHATNFLFVRKVAEIATKTTQTCTIRRGVWNLPHKFHLYLNNVKRDGWLNDKINIYTLLWYFIEWSKLRSLTQLSYNLDHQQPPFLPLFPKVIYLCFIVWRTERLVQAYYFVFFSGLKLQCEKYLDHTAHERKQGKYFMILEKTSLSLSHTHTDTNTHTHTPLSHSISHSPFLRKSSPESVTSITANAKDSFTRQFSKKREREREIWCVCIRDVGRKKRKNGKE